MSFELQLHTETVDQCHPAEPLCMAPTVSLGEALRQMRELNRGTLLVCQNQILVGIFTERDALKLMAEGANFDVPLSQVMTPDPVVLRADDKVAKAITLMAEGGYRRMPIVDEHGRPTGLVKVGGILHYLVEHFPAVIYNLPPEPHHSTQQREGA